MTSINHDDFKEVGALEQEEHKNDGVKENSLIEPSSLDAHVDSKQAPSTEVKEELSLKEHSEPSKERPEPSSAQDEQTNEQESEAQGQEERGQEEQILQAQTIKPHEDAQIKDAPKLKARLSSVAKSIKLEIMKFKMGQPSLIEASAGTGKTYTITNLVLRALLGLGNTDTALERPLQIDELLVVTFTNAATSDLRKRIYERIRKARMCLEEFEACVVSLAKDSSDMSELKVKMADELGLNHTQAASANKAQKKSRKKRSTQESEAIALLTKGDLGLDELDEYEPLTDLPSLLSYEQLKNLLVRVDLKRVFEMLKLSELDEAVIRELLERQNVSMSEAILILARAERKINNAAICTIHSFCNNILTKMYALESGEAFDTELKTDLSYEINEAFLQMWRRLFYKKDSSYLLLHTLGITDPIDMEQHINALKAVQLPSEKQGFFGFQLESFDSLLSKYECKISNKDPRAFEEQFVEFIHDLSINVGELNLEKYEYLKKLLAAIKQEDFERIYSIKEHNLTITYRDAGVKIRKNAIPNLDAFNRIYKLRSAIEQRISELKESTKIDNNKVGAGVITKDLATDYSLGALINDFFKEVNIASAKKDDFFLKLPAKLNVQIAQQLQGLNDQLKVFKSKWWEYVINDVYGDSYKFLVRTLAAIALNREFERKCRELNVMGADDVLRRLDFALNNRGDHGKRLAKLIRARYPLAMIDEFQDTDPVQFNIFKSIYLNDEALEDHAYCYLIGDPKQAIYAFRGSDINSYLKAKNIIKKLTHNQGLYTLDTNYRSSPDVVDGCNAIFSTKLKKSNDNPFDESEIPFEEVSSGVALNLKSKLTKAQQKKVQKREFTIKDFDKYLSSEQAPHGSLGNAGLKFEGNANNYVVDLGDELFTSISKLDEQYSRVCALLVKKLLKDGYIIKDGHEIKVKSSDIAILVSNVNQNNRIQSELSALQIPSVYYSDNSSVLVKTVGSNKYYEDCSVIEASDEAMDLLYLMDAMCNYNKRPQVNRLLASQLLGLEADEYRLMITNNGLVDEAMCLFSCAQVWREYGFMPAFFKWANEHRVCNRLLAKQGGERRYTNYCHICEIIQTVHQKDAGIETQMHWFLDLIKRDSSMFESDFKRKRLESEQEQIKILTIHKSKGLEFPIVLMPFLWGFKQANSGVDTYFNSAQYYSDKVGKVVQDFKPLRDIDYPLEPTKKNSPLGHTTPAEINLTESKREATRLLYVALTRARYANFIFVGNYKGKSKPFALPTMHSNHENLGQEQASGCFTFLSEPLIEAVKQYPDCFTIVSATKVCADAKNEQEALNTTQDPQGDQNLDSLESEAMARALSSKDLLTDGDKQSTHIRKNPCASVEPLAISFTYQDAISSHFNIYSYTRLVNQTISYNLRYLGDLDDSQEDDALSKDEHDSALLASSLNPHQGNNEEITYAIPECIELGESSIYDVDTSTCAYMQNAYEQRCYIDVEDAIASKNNRFVEEGFLPMPLPMAHFFPRGKKTGEFIHRILSKIDIEKLRQKGWQEYLGNEIFARMNYEHQLERWTSRIAREDIANQGEVDMALWFNDILEAPVLVGKYHCLALSDLQPYSYEHEMQFWLSGGEVKTDVLDQICKDVASDIIKDKTKLDKVLDNLVLAPQELSGFANGSIDLCCRFDLNTRLNLRYRKDLFDCLATTKKLALQQADPRAWQSSQGQDQGILLNNSEGADVKYYVIDYKTNALTKRIKGVISIEEYDEYFGWEDQYQCYEYEHLVDSIYEHRYDVQFILYTLALYRHLKRRFAVPINTTYEELEAFYNKNIGGVIYLFVRGMRANYLRNQISDGVFFTKIAFKHIHKLDCLLS